MVSLIEISASTVLLFEITLNKATVCSSELSVKHGSSM